MSLKSFLSAVGADFKKGLDFALKLEPAVEAGLAIADPPIAALLHVTTATIMNVEQKFAAMGTQSGTGAQKLAQAIQILEPTVVSTFAQYGETLNTSGVQNYINAVVALLNTLPASAATLAPAAPAPTVATSVSIPIVTPITLVAAPTPATEPPQAGG